MPQLASTANTPDELWPKVIRQIADLKFAAMAQRQNRDVELAIQIETMIGQHFQEPLDEMIGGEQFSSGGYGMDMPMGPPGMPPGMPAAGPAAAATNPQSNYGAPGGPGGAINLDDLGRILG